MMTGWQALEREADQVAKTTAMEDRQWNAGASAV